MDEKKEILKSETKRKRRCPYEKKCGGCNFVSTPMDIQASKKERRVKEYIGDFGPVMPIIRMKNPDHYRNKVTFAYRIDYRHGKKPYCGFYEQKSHDVVDVEKCLLDDRRADEICRAVLSLIPSFKIPIYDEDRGTGILRYVQVRTARATRQVMVTIVATTPVFPAKNNFVKALLKLQPEITTILLNVNTRTDSMILGDREIVLYGPGFIEDRLCGKTFRISSRSFYQVNPIQTEKLYNIAVDFAGLSGKETILDAYCGIGTIGICASDKAAHVIGVEVNGEAVKDAKENVKMNGLNADKFSYFAGDAGEFMTGMAGEGKCPDVVFMDPPRAGASEEFLRALLSLGPKKIVYISCDPETLGRDLAILCEKDYRMKKATPLDLFPHTGHVETVVLLSGEKVDGHIDIDLDVEKLEGKSGTATYAEIKKYVKDKYDFNVTPLCIGQIKDKVGIKDRKNYNTGSGDGKVPVCPPEKEAAIMDAFKHFGLI